MCRVLVSEIYGIKQIPVLFPRICDQICAMNMEYDPGDKLE